MTFGNDTGKSSAAGVPSQTPSDKSDDGLYVGQVYLGWHPADWFEMTVGKMPMPLYTTPMVWDSDINPEGAFEKLKFTLGNAELFADFGQFEYLSPTPALTFPSSDTFLLAWQAGANVKLGKDMFLKIAPVLYTYTGVGNSRDSVKFSSARAPSGRIIPTIRTVSMTSWSWKSPWNLILKSTIQNSAPSRLVCSVMSRIIGKAMTYRARAAYAAGGGNGLGGAFPGLSSAATGQNKAYQVGLGIGNAGPVYGPTQGLVYGSTSKKNTWEARFYWQRVEQYALDVNLMDSDFFEGRANLQGFFLAFAYGLTDAMIGTIRYGYAQPIKDSLGTGGDNLDIPIVNPIKDYNLLQLDLTWRF